MIRKKRLTYIISDIDKALAFEWIVEKIDYKKYDLYFILLVNKRSTFEEFLDTRGIARSVFYYESKKDLVYILYYIYKKLKNQKTDVVHCHLLYGSLLGLTAAFLAGIRKRIYTRHHSDYHFRYFPKGVKWDKWCNFFCN